MPSIVKWLVLIVVLVVVAVGARIYKTRQNAEESAPLQTASAPKPVDAAEPVVEAEPPPPTPEAIEKAVDTMRAQPSCQHTSGNVEIEVTPTDVVVTNCTTADVCYALMDGAKSGTAFVPNWCVRPLVIGGRDNVSTAKIDRKLTEAVELKWWHKGKKIAEPNRYGAGHVRSVIIKFPRAS